MVFFERTLKPQATLDDAYDYIDIVIDGTHGNLPMPPEVRVGEAIINMGIAGAYRDLRIVLDPALDARKIQLPYPSST